MSDQPLRFPRLEAWGLRHPWVFALIPTVLGALVGVPLLWFMGARSVNLVVFSVVPLVGWYLFVGWNFSRGPGYRNVRRRLGREQ